MADMERRRRRPENQDTANGRKRPARRAKGRRRGAAGSVLVRLFAMLMTVAIILAAAVIFFKVTELQVTGNQMYTREQVIEASGISEGDNLLLVKASSAAARIKVMLPYVQNVRISRVLPRTVQIEISESEVAFAVEASDGSLWLINTAGKLLEEAEMGAADYPRLTGVIAKSPEAGMDLITDQEENLKAALQLISLIEEFDLAPRITEVNVEKTYDLVMWYDRQYEVRLGGSDELSYKLRYLLSILNQLEGGRSGIIDLTLEDKDVAIFREWENDESGADKTVTGPAAEESEREE